MQQLQTNHFSIFKLNDKFYIAEDSWQEVNPNVFHTLEDAHLWLIEKAKEISTPETKLICVEVLKEYKFVCESNENNT